jgi:ABC-type glycerol-3-phosphate transport system substrate-binding protein
MDITTGVIPDILNFGTTNSIQTELIDKGLQDYRNYSEGKLYALPRKANAYYLYYNKDIFDRFNVPYPSKDKVLTWDEAFELYCRRSIFYILYCTCTETPNKQS